MKQRQDFYEKNIQRHVGGDFEGALKFYEKVMPKDVNKLRDVYILGGLASYYLNLEDRKTAGIYIARLEELKTSGKSVVPGWT